MGPPGPPLGNIGPRENHKSQKTNKFQKANNKFKKEGLVLIFLDGGACVCAKRPAQVISTALLKSSGILHRIRVAMSIQ